MWETHSGRSTEHKGATARSPPVPWHGRELPLAPWQGTGSIFQKRPQGSTWTGKAVFPKREVFQAGPDLQWEFILKLGCSFKQLAKIHMLTPQQKHLFSLSLASMVLVL